MADKKITDLGAAAALDGADLFEVVQAGANKKMTGTQLATAIVALIVDSAPGTLDTLNELAAALGDDPNFAATTATALAGKQALNTLLTAISGLGANGLVARTGSGAAAARTVTGTAAQIAVADGDGVAGNPVLSLVQGLLFPGAIGVARLGISSARTLDHTDCLVRCDATGGAFTVTLPAAAAAPGRAYIVRKVDASVNAVTVDGDASEQIDGGAGVSLTTQYATALVISNGTGWDRIV